MQGTWPALWSFSGEVWPCSYTFTSLVVHILEQGGPCRVLPAQPESYLVFCFPLSIPKGHAMWQQPHPHLHSEHWDLTHLPRGRTFTRFRTSSSLSESLVSATAWLWGARGQEGQGSLGGLPPHSPSITVPLTSGSSGSSGWAEPSVGGYTLGRGRHVPCGEE